MPLSKRMTNPEIKYQINEAIAEHCDVDFAKHEQLRNDFLLEMKKINMKLDAMTPTIKEIQDFKTAWNIGGSFGSWLVKFVLGIGVIMGAIFALKEWIKK